MSFDPYQTWLDIPQGPEPVNHYRLLGLPRGEPDMAAIAAAAERAMRHVRQFAAGPNAIQCAELLGELQLARDCLLDPAAKAAYDQRLGLSPSGNVEQPLAGPKPTASLFAGEGQIRGAPPPPGQSPQNDVAPTASSAPVAKPLPPVAQPVASPAPTSPSPQVIRRPEAAPEATAKSQAAAPEATPGSAAHGPPSPPPPVNPPPAPLAPQTPEQPTAEAGQPGGWIPPERTGRVGTQVASVVEGKTAPRPSTSTRKASVLRRRRVAESERTTGMLALVLVAGGVLLLFVVVLLVLNFGG